MIPPFYYFATFKPVAPLIGAALSGLFLGGIFQLALWLNRRLHWGFDPLRWSALAVCVLAVIAVMVQGLVMASCAYQEVLMGVFGGICAAGVLLIWRLCSEWRQIAEWGRCRLESGQWGMMETAGWSLLAVLVVLYGLLALGPVRDTDSISYHMGAALDILRHHGLAPRADWLTMRLAGAGEHFNLLGLSAGVETVGSVLQWGGVAMVVMCLAFAPGRRENRLWAALAFASIPHISWLVGNQKPQLLPLGAVVVAALLLARHQRSHNTARELLAFGCVFFAVACKHSFILTGGVVVLVWLHISWRRKALLMSVVRLVLAYALLASPFHIWKLVMFGDPLSPLLERFKASPEPALLILAESLRNYQDSMAAFPFHLIIPRSWVVANLVLGFGLGVAVVLLNPFKAGRGARLLMGVAAAQVVFILMAGQCTTRFMLEPFSLLLCGLALASGVRVHAWQAGLTGVQALITIARVTDVVLLLLPAVWNGELKDKVMSQASHGYALCKWLNQTLPSDSVVLIDTQSNYFAPRRFVTGATCFYDASLPGQIERVRKALQEAKLDTLVCEKKDLAKYAQFGITPLRERAPDRAFKRRAEGYSRRNVDEEVVYHVYQVRIEP